MAEDIIDTNIHGLATNLAFESNELNYNPQLTRNKIDFNQNDTSSTVRKLMRTMLTLGAAGARNSNTIHWTPPSTIGCVCTNCEWSSLRFQRGGIRSSTVSQTMQQCNGSYCFIAKESLHLTGGGIAIYFVEPHQQIAHDRLVLPIQSVRSFVKQHTPCDTRAHNGAYCTCRFSVGAFSICLCSCE